LATTGKASLPNNTHAQPGTTNHEIKGQNIVISYKTGFSSHSIALLFFINDLLLLISGGHHATILET